MGPGDIIAGRFVVERQVGAGAMGLVFLAVDTERGEKVALKVLRTAGDDVAPDSTRRRFAIEAQTLAQLEHPALVRYLAHHEGPENPYLVMEWLEGETLAARLKRKASLTIAEVVAIGERLAGGLAVAHQAGVIHRDVKPSNVLLVRNHPHEAKLLDFGVARLAGGAQLTRTGALVGTPGFAAPEQARGQSNIDARADIFALGCVLFASVTGRAPFAGEDLVAIIAKTLFVPAPRLRSFRPEAPAWLDDLVDWMLAKERDERPTSANEVLSALQKTAVIPREEPSATSLTGSEQRVVSVVVIGPRHADSLPEDEVATVATSQTTSLTGMCTSHGGRVENLQDGSLVATWVGGEATDRAASAARFALSAIALIPDRRIAMTTGRAIDEGAIGEAIDRAFSVYREAGDPGIWLDDVSVGLLGAKFETAGTALLAERSRSGPRLLLGKPSPFVGRQRELGMLVSICNESFGESVPRVALVVGEPGKGKSRLKDKLLEAITDTPHETWIFRGDPIRERSPFGVITALVESSGARDEPESVELLTHLARLADDTELRDPAVIARSISLAWIAFVRARCARGPVLAVLEDLHWGDPSSVRAIDASLKELRDSPFFVLALARPSVRNLAPSLWSGRGLLEMELSDLSRKAAESFVREVVPDATAADLERVVTQAAGNPLHLEELVRALASGNRDRLPESITAIFQARLEALDTDSRRVLRAASIFGDAFWPPAVQSLVGETIDVSRILANLEIKELVGSREGSRFASTRELTFRHAETRDAAYATLTNEDKKLGHGLAATWLEGKGENDPVVLGTHYELAGEPERAAAMHCRALDQALRANELKLAREYAERAIALEPSAGVLANVLGLQARISLFSGDLRSAIEIARSAIEKAEPGSVNWYRGLSVAMAASGRVDTNVDDLAGDLLDSVPSDEAIGLYADACRRASARFLNAGKMEIARRFRECFNAVTPGSTGTLEVLFAAGDYEQYLAIVRADEQRGAVTGDPHLQLGSRAYAGFALYELGALEEAETQLREVCAKADEIPMAWVASYARMVLSACAFERRDYEAARDVAATSSEWFVGHGDTRLTSHCKAMQGRAEHALGNLDAAEKLAMEAVAAAVPWPAAHAAAFAGLANILLAKGDTAGAREASDQSQIIVDELVGLGHGDAFARLVRARVLDACGAQSDARATLAQARDRLLVRAAAVSDSFRRGFLEGFRDNVDTFALAKEWNV